MLSCFTERPFILEFSAVRGLYWTRRSSRILAHCVQCMDYDAHFCIRLDIRDCWPQLDFATWWLRERLNASSNKSRHITWCAHSSHLSNQPSHSTKLGSYQHRVERVMSRSFNLVLFRPIVRFITGHLFSSWYSKAIISLYNCLKFRLIEGNFLSVFVAFFKKSYWAVGFLVIGSVVLFGCASEELESDFYWNSM